MHTQTQNLNEKQRFQLKAKGALQTDVIGEPFQVP